MEKKPKRLYIFGPFHLDTGERLLLRDGAVVPLKPKAFDVLLALLDQPGRLLEKETLLETVWPDSFVEENNLADNISQLRKALGEGENGQKFIETVPKRGYRFIADVHTAKDTILLADFENKTGDEIFDKMLKQGLAIQLRQSPFLNLFPEAQTRHELKLMRRSPEERVTAEIAQEICERQNLKAFIAGSIAPLGSHYVITLEAINGQSGEPLAQEQVEAENKEQTLQALSRAATRLRERLGESLSSIRRFDRPLVEGTTSKLEAFKAFSQGYELALGGQLREAITSYKHATEIDPEFAHAYCLLAVMLYATGRPELAAEYAQKAYQLKDRAGEFEKIRIAIWYHGLCAGDLNKRIEMAKLHKRTYPRDVTGPNDLAVAYILLGRYDQALAAAREAVSLSPYFAAAYKHIAMALIRLNRFAEAKDILAQASQRNLEMIEYHTHLYQIAFAGGDAAEAQEQIDWARGAPDESTAFDWQAQAAAGAGQWRKAQEFSRRAIEMTERGDKVEIAALYATEQALRGAVFGDCPQARVDAERGLKLAPGRASMQRAALALAMCGQTDRAKSLAGELTKRYPEDTLINSIWIPEIHAAMELQHGNAAQAIDRLQAVSRYEAAAELWPQYLRGQAYLKLGRGAEAAAEFQNVLDHKGHAPLSPLYPLAHLGLGRAAMMAGDSAKSRKAYEDFFRAWKDADHDLPIFREAERDWIAGLSCSR